ncbi:hypothetical protein [Pseudoalteromonas rubra]|uniref:ABC-2 type transporter domain-containing protein n=1 Tax=Pseudoalteromonas rubra TaxID=43658 RepID=A0A0F4QI74_9GAMM|nr:hypothetical protein [Pseudoalteromonas rubra]KJZ06960.1 hypothetical protein TW77_17245 [Pseudoalteromonas rubra]
MNFITLLGLELHRKWVTAKRYPLNFYASIVFAAVILILVISGASYLSGGALSLQRMESLVLGYYLWTLTVGISSAAAEEVVEDAKLGTLPHILTSATSLFSVLLARKVVLVLYQLLVVGVGFVFINWYFDLQIRFHPMMLWVFLQIVVAGFAVSYLLGAIALVNKQMSTFIAFVQLLLIMVFLVPIESELSLYIPVSGSMYLLRSLASGIPVEASQMVLASLPSVILFMLSSLFFHFMYKQARRRDVVTQL